jgi:hypothetical protein
MTPSPACCIDARAQNRRCTGLTDLRGAYDQSVALRDRLRRFLSRPRGGWKTIFLRQPNDMGFADDEVEPGHRFWSGVGGAVMVGFRDPELGPHLPSVPEDDPHRTSPPSWLTEDAPDNDT